MQVLPRVTEGEIINGQQSQPPQDARGVTFQIPQSSSEPSSSTTSPAPFSSSPTSLPQPQQGGIVMVATAAATSTAGDTTTSAMAIEDHNCDSDSEALAGWSGMATKEEIQEGQIIKAGYLMKKGERLKVCMHARSPCLNSLTTRKSENNNTPPPPPRRGLVIHQRIPRVVVSISDTFLLYLRETKKKMGDFFSSRLNC